MSKTLSGIVSPVSHHPDMLPPSMHAAVLHRPGDLRYETVPTPVPGPAQAVIRVTAAGHCGSDLHRIMVAGTYSFPTIPGHEFAGRVAAVAADVDSSWIGRRVAVIPLIPCGRCGYCRAGQTYLCLHYNYLGSRSDGGYAEFAAAPVANLVPLPDAIDDEDGAALEPSAVTIHGIRRAGGIVPGSDVLILGAGSIGAFAVQWARALGAGRVLVCDVDDHKLDMALVLGADLVANPSRDDVDAAVRKATDGLGAELVVEASGEASVQRYTLDLVRKHGRIVWLGIAHAEVTISSEAIFRKEPAVFGSFNYTFGTRDSDWNVALSFMAARRITVKPIISHRLRLEEAPAIYHAMNEGRLHYHKVLFLP